MPLRDVSMLSSEEASTQNTCEKLTRNKSHVIDGKIETLLVRHFLYKLETNLGLSNPSHSPEETGVSSAGNMMSKYLLKYIKYISSSSKDWTRVGHLSYRDVYQHTISISRENILSIKLMLKSQTLLQQRLTIKVPPVMKTFWAFK